MPSQVNVGSQQAISMTFRDYLGVLSDPSTITLVIHTPDDVVETILNGVMVNLSVGVWYALYTPTLFGRYYYKITTTGTPTLVIRGTFDTGFNEPL